MKRSRELEPLSHDHFEGLLLASRMAKGIDNLAPPAVVSAYISHSWQTNLSEHFRLEENLLLPLAVSAKTTALGSRMLKEHATIKTLVDTIRDKPASCTDFVLELSRQLTSHIRFEERELFPALENELSAERLREVGRRLHESANVPAGPEWTVAFWEGNAFSVGNKASGANAASKAEPAPRTDPTQSDKHKSARTGEQSVAMATRNACLAAAMAAYEDAMIAGLCREGAWENAIGAIKSVDLESVLQAERDE